MKSGPMIAFSRSCSAPAGMDVRLPPRNWSKAVSKWAKAKRRRAKATAWVSERSVFRNLRRAGVLKNRSSTSTVVPGGWAQGPRPVSWPPASRMLQALSSPAARLLRVRRATEAALARASPRKPKLATPIRSPAWVILLVAWRLTAKGKSSR